MSADPTRRLVLVTGASQGIGRAIAARLAQDGFDLALIARRAEVLEELAASLSQGEGSAEGFACDVADSEAVSTTVKAVVERFGRIDAVVNNAGITRDALLVRMKDEQWSDVIRTNLDGCYNLVR